MQRVARLFSVFFMIVGATLCVAQGPCPTQSSTQTTTIPTRSGKLICLVPQVYGPGGLVGVDHGGPLLSTALFSHAAHFTNSALQSLVPLNAEIGTQISQLPITSPVSGFVFSFNPSLGCGLKADRGFRSSAHRATLKRLASTRSSSDLPISTSILIRRME